MSRREREREERTAERKTVIARLAGIGAGRTRGARDDPNHVAIYLSRESGHYRVKFG